MDNHTFSPDLQINLRLMHQELWVPWLTLARSVSSSQIVLWLWLSHMGVEHFIAPSQSVIPFFAFIILSHTIIAQSKKLGGLWS